MSQEKSKMFTDGGFGFASMSGAIQKNQHEKL